MSFSRALYNKISADLITAAIDTPFVYGSAEGNTPPYFVMLKVSDPERNETLCKEQGADGRAQFQFSVTGESLAGGAEITLEDLKAVVAGILGDIVYNGTTYSVWNNVTSGITPLGGVALNTWDAIFTTVFWWSLKS